MGLRLVKTTRPDGCKTCGSLHIVKTVSGGVVCGDCKAYSPQDLSSSKLSDLQKQFQQLQVLRDKLRKEIDELEALVRK